MTSETAGPSTEATAEELQKATEAYEEGLQNLKHGKLDTAVELLGEALHIRIKAHGDLAPECAVFYQRYGEALFQKAQSESDVFGASLQQASRNRQQDDEEAAEEAEEEVHQKAQHDEKENVDAKGKAPMPEEDIGEEEPVLEDGDDDEDAEEGDEGDSDDMKLAWEMLEVARTICPKDKPLQLADVLMLLGDLAMETERFDSAMTDYEQALGLLKAHLQADDRRIAEAHYKLSLTLHFLDNAEDALKHARAAVAVCNARIAHLAPAAAAAAPADTEEPAASAGADAPAAEDAALAAQREIADLKGVLSDLAVKVEELEGAVRENESTRNALKAAFSRLAAAQVPSEGGSGSSSAAAGASQQAAAPGGVINLGVVGRGSKRINLQPVSAAAAPSTDDAAPKPKRSLEDMMGSGAATSIGFGAPVSIPAGFGAGSSSATAAAPQLAGGVAKKPKQELQERIDNAQAAAGAPAAAKPAALPAFLQSSTVAAVYGSGQQSTADGQQQSAGQNTQEAEAEG
ncbi:probable histone-binding protein N1/N2 [Coccomyxa sp. Obi]|nr:probable histone-binding protein N1/N2 [Coccomyxa sp. Obi]